MSTNIGEIPGKLYALLHGLSSDDRKKVISATVALFGDAAPNTNHQAGSPTNERTGLDEASTPKVFFDQKEPRTKGEELATAARYLELQKGTDLFNKEDLKTVFSTARRNFDSANFLADMSNAIHQAKFFTKGGPKGLYQLSYFGRKFIDALPDRQKAKQAKARKSTRK